MVIESTIALFASATSSWSLLGVILGLLVISSTAFFLPSRKKSVALVPAPVSEEPGDPRLGIRILHFDLL